MISQEVRNQLLTQTRKGDYERAAQIYLIKVSKEVSTRYLQNFLEGRNNPTGIRPGTHDPVAMFDAIAEAVAERQKTEEIKTAQALEILRTKIRIERPQPIPL